MSTNILGYRSAPAVPAELEPAESGMPTLTQQLPAWAVSLGVHLLLLFVMYQIVSPPPPREEFNTIIDSELVEELDPQAMHLDATETDQIGTTDSDMNVVSPAQAAAPRKAEEAQQRVEQQLKEDFNLPIKPVAPENLVVDEAPLTGRVSSEGVAMTDHPGGTQGAVDRLTKEIAASLRERKTLVVWMLDASLSMREKRETIADRIDNIYKQLGQLDVQSDRALKSAVVSFGHRTQILTPEPVDDPQAVSEAIRKIEDDVSGQEFVFSAVNEAARRWKDYRQKMQRNVMIIIVTDERGDDHALPGRPNFLEEVIAFNRRYGIRVYCVGNAALFGQEKGYVSFTDAEGFTYNDLPVDAGPETVAPEMLQLAFWGTNGGDLDRMSASFGPYALSRLCAETGGIYLVAEESQQRNFDFAVMRNYIPDYRPVAEYQRELQRNAAKRALVETALQTKVDDIPVPQLVFTADNDTVLRQDIDRAQKGAITVLDYFLAQAHQKLELGEKDRDKLTSARWRAAFDLAMGRILAMRVRAYGYNATLAEMKVQPRPFEKKDSNRWRLVPSGTVDSGPQTKKWAQKATEYLTRVINEHPGTPWAALAERELSVPMGWEWQEFGVAPPPQMAQRPDEDRPMLLLAPEEQEREMQRKREEEKRRNPPKL